MLTLTKDLIQYLTNYLSLKDMFNLSITYRLFHNNIIIHNIIEDSRHIYMNCFHNVIKLNHENQRITFDNALVRSIITSNIHMFDFLMQFMTKKIDNFTIIPVTLEHKNKYFYYKLKPFWHKKMWINRQDHHVFDLMLFALNAKSDPLEAIRFVSTLDTNFSDGERSIAYAKQIGQSEEVISYLRKVYSINDDDDIDNDIIRDINTNAKRQIFQSIDIRSPKRHKFKTI